MSMFKRITFAAVLLATLAECQSATQKTNYPRMDEAMKSFTDYTWTPVEFTTDDDFILTSFMI